MPVPARRRLPSSAALLALAAVLVCTATAGAATPPQYLNRQFSDAVHDLRLCLKTLPDKQRRLVVLRSGIGPNDPASGSAVAAALGIPASTVATAQWDAVRAMRAARDAGRCQGAGATKPVTSTTPSSPPSAAAKLTPSAVANEQAHKGASLTEPRSLLLLALIGLCLAGLGRELFRALRV